MRKIWNFYITSMLVFSLMGLSACGGGGGGSNGDTPATVTPSAPTGVTATAGDSQVILSWTAVTGATTYNIYWSTTSGITKTNGTKITGATSPYILTGLTNGTTSYYVVTAANSAGESLESSEVSATPAATATAKAITTFSFATPAATGTITEATHTIAVTVPSGTVITGLTPTITHTGTIISPASGVAQDFTSPVTYTVTAADSSTQAYTVTVTIGGGTWTVSEVGSIGSHGGAYSSGGSYLGIDSAGKPHIGYTYYPGTAYVFDTSVAYATRDNSTWSANVILTHANIGGLKLNTDGMPRTLLDWDNFWYSGGWYSVGYGLLQDDTWSKVAVEDDLHMGSSPSAFTLNAQDEALIVFVDPYNSLLRYAKVVGTTPAVVTLISGLSTNEISEIQIAADKNGYPHIAYITDSYSLVYGHYNGSSWSFETVVAASTNGLSSLSMAVDGNNVPHFSYDDDASGLVYTTKSGGSWISTAIDQYGAHSTSIAIDTLGYPHIAYAHNMASYASWNGSAWTIELVEGNDAGVNGISLALDPTSGKPRMSYFEHTWDIVKFAERE